MTLKAAFRIRTAYLLQKNGKTVITKQSIKSDIVKDIMNLVFITE